jgi:hypothetical protein
VQVLGEGELSKTLTIKAAKFSSSAAEKIAAAGATAESVPQRAKWTRKAHEKVRRQSGFCYPSSYGYARTLYERVLLSQVGQAWVANCYTAALLGGLGVVYAVVNLTVCCPCWLLIWTVCVSSNCCSVLLR